MLKFKGFIFDVDDTILDNKSGIPGAGLHEKSRLKACMILGEELGIKELTQITLQENFDCFVNAKVHSMEGGVWSLLFAKGLVASEGIDYQNELLIRIVRLKDEIHEQVLLDEAEEVPGAIQFIKDLESVGYGDKMAVASSAIRRDIDLFFGKNGLDKYFSNARILCKDNFTHTKPHPEVFNMAFATLGLPESDRKHVLAIEDDPRGIMSAVAAGLSVCAITTRFSKKDLESLEIPPDFVVESFEEARTIVGLL